MKRTLPTLAMLLVLLFSSQRVVNDCTTDSDCERVESVLDRQIRIVNKKAAREGWIDEAKERD